MHSYMEIMSCKTRLAEEKQAVSYANLSTVLYQLNLAATNITHVLKSDKTQSSLHLELH